MVGGSQEFIQAGVLNRAESLVRSDASGGLDWGALLSFSGNLQPDRNLDAALGAHIVKIEAPVLVS